MQKMLPGQGAEFACRRRGERENFAFKPCLHAKNAFRKSINIIQNK
jgi:hypothetical protein